MLSLLISSARNSSAQKLSYKLAFLFFSFFLIVGVPPQKSVGQNLPDAPASPITVLLNKTMPDKPAKELFGAVKFPANLRSKPIGFYSKGCLAGARALPVTGPAWQVMRLSRNRHWGYPHLIALLEKLAVETRNSDGWNGLLVGDLSQPRGGPMSSGHASHQVGLDADIWLTPMPDRILTKQERENISPRIMVKDRKTLDHSAWSVAHALLIKRAANMKEVTRIFVHPPIKAELCRWATGDRAWLAKVRPYYGHTYHFHLRISCPSNASNCKDQDPPRPLDGTGCGDELAYWMSDKPWPPPPPEPLPPPPPPMSLAQLPPECRSVLTAP